jgi:penicillin-binding protein 2
MAIAESCDTYFYDLGRRLTIDRMAEYLAPYGLGDLTGVDTTNERRGVLPSTQWKRDALNQPWYPGETISASIGQGYMLTTPMQLAVATSVLASKGARRVPRLLMAVDGTPLDAPELEPMRAKPENWEAVYKGMLDVVHSKRGTAKALAKGIRYQMAGKTGTAQVIGIAQNAVYKEDEVDERHRHHGLFIAFAPAEAPTIAVAIIVENGGGSSAASPIARHVIDTWLFGRSEFEDPA